jgi:hypothetical protein
MSDCGWLSDRMPAVATGRAEWTPEEVRHLSGCQMCQQEWELMRVARRVGENAGASFNLPAMTSSVLRRLEAEREAGRRRRRTWSFTGLAAAAAIAAAIWTGGGESGMTDPAPSAQMVATGLAIPLPELESLQTAELDSVLQTMDEPNASGTPVDEPGLGDLNSDELESVLDSWEG